MNRSQMITALQAQNNWDVCIVGGGATGLGIAIDAASRGYSTLLIEQFDFAKGTSSRSTKLVHGGVRYLQQGNVKLVMEALKERGLLRKNAPHLVKNQSFLLPNYKWWEGPFYGIGLKIYDWMAGKLGLGPSLILSREEALKHAPTLNPEGLKGGVLYHDGQFDDARLAINLAQTAAEQKGVLLNYLKANSLIKIDGKVTGIKATDQLDGREYTINAKIVINATGIFTDILRKDDDPGKAPVLALSQGTHLVVDQSFLPGDTAIMIPETSDGRVLFAVPWHQQLIIGTTDVPVNTPTAEPVPQAEEISFILEHIGQYLAKHPKKEDIKSVFSGLRPLVRGNASSTAALSRDHYIEVSESGLISITGGKWTTYRKMAEDAVNIAIRQQKIPDRPCITEGLPIHGAMTVKSYSEPGYYYGTDLLKIKQLELNQPELSEKIHERLPYTKATIVWAAREEMCMTVDDALSRRTRAILLDAAAAIEATPVVAHLLATEYGYTKQWEDEQVAAFQSIAQNYLPSK
ncbi:glycerol-3-phosphate dehydrogenase/oxidase [Flavihumibacter profundi]|uniref:glycerol-3-phosphate dehydrogenase/oxidase n=1 Tax=Flavihumibacter profundi TaxID=2716883 RepID=UPI001CC7BF21|nr:glycerol-3-phosphate dehydrogenase/oxidase [Flavihumibacter profundi]MBZ5858500.1 glycerol-3-phosphate dehydrogenase/oxidase [Flavihumibacter profundi]